MRALMLDSEGLRPLVFHGSLADFLLTIFVAAIPLAFDWSIRNGKSGRGGSEPVAFFALMAESILASL